MTEDERLAYEKRRADELYDNMLKGQEVAKQRAADVVIEIMASLPSADHYCVLYRNNGSNQRKEQKQLKDNIDSRL